MNPHDKISALMKKEHDLDAHCELFEQTPYLNSEGVNVCKTEIKLSPDT